MLSELAQLAVRGWATSSPFVRSMIGEPTASSKFADMMVTAVSSYLSTELSPSSSPTEPVLNPDALVVIPLEGEGRVDDRVEVLYKQLQRAPEWVAALKEADAVFVVAHSQGSVVSTKLLARLVEKGEVKGEHVTFLSMCGVYNGPFVGLSQSYALQPYFQASRHWQC